MKISELKAGKKLYLASDFHLGVPSPEESLLREKKIVQWLDSISDDAQCIILLGDVFDFWFEYKHVAPKGYVRFLGKLATLSDAGVELIIFCGNHDLWFNEYLDRELNAQIIRNPVSFHLGDKLFYLAHGDGLGDGHASFKVIKWVFTNGLCQWFFQWLHPNIGFGLAEMWSRRSKNRSDTEGEGQKLINYSKKLESQKHHDYYIYGDCHEDKYEEIGDNSIYVNLGDWIDKFSYAEFDGNEISLKYFRS